MRRTPRQVYSPPPRGGVEKAHARLRPTGLDMANLQPLMTTRISPIKESARSQTAPTGITAVSRTPLWLAAGSGCRDQRLSKVSGSRDMRSWLLSCHLTSHVLYLVAGEPAHL